MKINPELDFKVILLAATLLVSVAASATVTAVMASRTAAKLEKVDQRVTVLEKSAWTRAGYEQAVRDLRGRDN